MFDAHHEPSLHIDLGKFESKLLSVSLFIFATLSDIQCLGGAAVMVRIRVSVHIVLLTRLICCDTGFING